MRNTIIILLFPLFATSQAVVDKDGNIVNYAKYSDSLTGVVATAYKLKIKTDSLATALAATNAALLALKCAYLDTSVMLAGYTRKSAPLFTVGLGYTTGAGGTVTQATSKSTGVTLNKLTGDITLNAAALAAATIVSFTLTNSTIAATDIIHVQHQTTGTFGAYTVNGRTAAGSAVISIRNNTAGSLSEAIVIKFIIVKSVTN